MRNSISTFIIGISLFLSFSLKGQIPTDSLVLHLPFTSNAYDVSNKGNDGTVYGATLASDRFGLSNDAYYFDGYDDYIDIPSIGDSTFRKDYTISIICSFSDFDKDYPSLIGGENSYISFLGTGPTYQQNAQKVSFYQGANDAPEQRRVPSFFSNTVLEANAYNHFIIVKNNDTVSLFIDGVLDTSVVANNTIDTPEGNGFYLGTGFKKESYQCFRGYIDDVAVYNKALSSNEVIGLFEAFKDPNTGLNAPDYLGTINVYPNPAKNYVIISSNNIDQLHNYNFRIVNLIGQSVYEGQLNQSELRINTEGLGNSGVYFIEIYDNFNTLLMNKKLIVN